MACGGQVVLVPLACTYLLNSLGMVRVNNSFMKSCSQGNMLDVLASCNAMMCIIKRCMTWAYNFARHYCSSEDKRLLLGRCDGNVQASDRVCHRFHLLVFLPASKHVLCGHLVLCGLMICASPTDHPLLSSGGSVASFLVCFIIKVQVAFKCHQSSMNVCVHSDTASGRESHAVIYSSTELARCDMHSLMLLFQFGACDALASVWNT